MYTAKAKIEIRTAPSYGATPESFKMFEIEIETVPSLRDWLLWVEQGYLPSYEEMPTIRPTQVRQIDEGTFEFTANMVLPMVLPGSTDDLTYYRKLVADGWKPNVEEDDVIRQRGYQNYRPESFQ